MDVRIVLWTCFVMTVIMTFTHTLFLPMLFSIIVMGIIPGTSLKIPTIVMLTAYPVLFVIGMYWLSTLQIMLGQPTHAIKPAPRTSHRKKVTSASSTLPATKQHVRSAI